MPAHTILGWLRRRRAVAHAALRYGGALRTYGANGRPGVSPNVWSVAGRLGGRRPVLRAPIDWRERMLARTDAAAPSMSPELESPIPAAAYVLPDDVTLVGGQRARGRPRAAPRIEVGADDALRRFGEAERRRAPSVAAPASETASVRAPSEPSGAAPAAQPPSTSLQPTDERRVASAGSSGAAVRADVSTPDAPIVERAHASGSDVVAPAARRGAEHAPPAGRTEDDSSRETAGAPSRAAPDGSVDASPSLREPSDDAAARVAAPSTASTEPTASVHSRRAPSDGGGDGPFEQVAQSGLAHDDAAPPAREPRVAPPAITDARHGATPAPAAHAGDEPTAASSRDAIASMPASAERTPRETATSSRVDASDTRSAARTARDDHEAPPPNAESASAQRDDGAPEGLRPIEERRARRPAARRPEPPPLDSERVEAASTDAPGTPAVDPGVARESATSERATSEEPVTSEGPAASERTTSDWRRLLFEATSEPARPRPASPVSPPARGAAASPTRAPDAAPLVAREEPRAAPPPATPLLESTRRFLRPRVGIDPASVTVVRGPDTDRLLAESAADAVAVGEVVALSSTLDERSPHALGVLAHELAHVAQRRHPRFVPPVLRAAESNASLPPSSRPIPSSEEALARRVEHAVRADAERIAHRDEGATYARDAEPIVAVPDQQAIPERHAQLWGSLPAPWEPLPYAPVATGEISAPATLVSPTVETAPVHYAEQGRTMEPEPQNGAAPAAPAPAPAPDLDVLARRVYDVLKRRLAAERRREG